MVRAMAPKPIIFAMANPDPEITPEEAHAAREDAIIATGRSDYPNQVNNVLGFPYIFRGALDVRASTINMEMKIAAVEAIAKLAREDVPDEVARAYSGRRLRYGPDYIIPAPFDPRLIVEVPSAVAQAAMDTKVAGKPLSNMEAYKAELQARLDPTAANLHSIFERVRRHPQTIVFAEGEEERAIRAALAFRNEGFGTPVLIGREDRVHETMRSIGIDPDTTGLAIRNARLDGKNQAYTELLYNRLQRRGFLMRDCQRLVNQDRNSYAASMVLAGDADGMVSGLTRSFGVTLEEIQRVIPTKPRHRMFGLSIMRIRGRTVFLADTTVHELPTADQLADITTQAAAKARQLGHEPRVAILSFSNFGNPMREKAQRMRDTVSLLDARQVDFEYDGEMTADIALDYDLMQSLYPFCRLSGAANVLIMPGLHSAHIAAKMLRELGGGVTIGPMLLGLSKPAQVAPMGATVSELLTSAALAAHDAILEHRG